MHVLWIILKILAFILLFLLALLLLVQIIPVRYRFEGRCMLLPEDAGEGKVLPDDRDPLWGQVQISWFFKTIFFRMTWAGGESTYQFRVLWFLISGNDPESLLKMEEKEKKKAGADKESLADEEWDFGIEEGDLEEETDYKIQDKGPSEETDLETGDRDLSKEKESGLQSGGDERLKEDIDLIESEDTEDLIARQSVHEEALTADEDAAGPEPAQEPQKALTDQDRVLPEKEDDRGIRKLFRIVIDRFQAFVHGIRSLMSGARSMKAAVLSLKDKGDQGLKLYKKLNGDALVAKTVLLNQKIIRHIFPRKLSGYLKYGTEDPAVTGYFTAFAATLYPLYGKYFSVQPNFYQSCFEGEGKGSGLVRPIYIIWLVIWMLLDRNVRRFIRYILWKRKKNRKNNKNQ